MDQPHFVVYKLRFYAACLDLGDGLGDDRSVLQQSVVCGLLSVDYSFCRPRIEVLCRFGKG